MGTTPLEQHLHSIGDSRVATARRLLRRVETRPEPEPTARVAILKKSNNSITAFIAQAYATDKDDLIHKDLDSYKEYQHFFSARFPDDRGMHDFAFEHAPTENDKQEYLFFTAMLSQHSYPSTAFQKGPRPSLRRRV